MIQLRHDFFTRLYKKLETFYLLIYTYALIFIHDCKPAIQEALNKHIHMSTHRPPPTHTHKHTYIEMTTQPHTICTTV